MFVALVHYFLAAPTTDFIEWSEAELKRCVNCPPDEQVTSTQLKERKTKRLQRRTEERTLRTDRSQRKVDAAAGTLTEASVHPPITKDGGVLARIPVG